MNRLRVVLDTNILISALLFGGKPREILHLRVLKKIQFITSIQLLAELSDVLSKKFKFSDEKTKAVDKKFRRMVLEVHPAFQINILADNVDNRILEAAVEGKCEYVITGDKNFRNLSKYQNIKIVTPSEFLEIMKE